MMKVSRSESKKKQTTTPWTTRFAHRHTPIACEYRKKIPRSISKSWIILGKYAHQDIYLVAPFKWTESWGHCNGINIHQRKKIRHPSIYTRHAWTKMNGTFKFIWENLWLCLVCFSLSGWCWKHSSIGQMKAVYLHSVRFEVINMWMPCNEHHLRKKWYRSLVLGQFYDAITLE